MTNIEKIIEEFEKKLEHPLHKDISSFTKASFKLFFSFSLLQIHQETLDEIANKFVEIEKDKWKDAEHCTCLGSAIVSVFGEKYEDILRVCKKREHKLK